MWVSGDLSTVTIVGSTKAVIGVLNANALTLRPFTLLRTRIQLLYESDQAAASERPRGTYGEIVVTDTAAALGPTAVPGPSSNANAKWHVHQPCVVSFGFLSSIGFESSQGRQYMIDSKVMRKVGQDEDIAVVFEQDSASGATLVVQGRLLIQLH